MQNIYEVVGIIKGIKFDNKINEKEISFLKEWTDHNRNFAITKNQKKLIYMIDKALEDNVLTDLERKTILSTAQTILDVQSVENLDMYIELNGILRGIISDNKLNNEEIIKLKKWFDFHKIEINKNNKEILMKVDSILEDEIITNEEQNELFILIKEKIDKLEMDAKIEYVKKLIRKRENIGIELIKLLDNEESMNYIHLLSQSQIRRTLNTYSSIIISDPEIVLISLSIIAMMNYNGSFYESVRRVYKELYNDFSQQKIEGLIRTLLNKYKNKTDDSSRQRVINVALRQAIVPKYFLASFFDFIYDIYKINFEYHLTDNLYKDFRFVFDGIRSNLSTDGDVVNLNVTHKSYKLIKTSKDLVAKEKNYDPIIKLSIIVIQLIDKYIWDKDVNVYSIYLKDGFEKWKLNFKEKERISKKTNWKSKWQPKFMLNEELVNLVLPAHKIKSKYDYKDIKIIIKNGNEVIYENSMPDIREIIGGYQIKSFNVVIDNPLGKLRYRLFAKEEVIYDSEDKLYRPYIVFKENGDEIKNNTNHSGMIILCSKQLPNNFLEIRKIGSYILSSKIIKLGEYEYLEGSLFNFSSLIKPIIIGETFKDVYMKKLNGTEILKVYKKIDFLIFEDENCESDYEIIINSRKYILEELLYKMESKKGRNKYLVKLPIERSNIYTISVERYNSKIRNQLYKFTFIYDPGLISTVVLRENKYIVFSISTGLKINKIEQKIYIKDFDINRLNFKFNGEIYIYRVPLNFEIYKISNYEWSIITESIWMDDVKQNSVLDIYNLDYDSIMITSSEGTVLEENIPLVDKVLYKEVNIGFLSTYKKSGSFINIFLLKNKKVEQVIRCNSQCMIPDNGVDISLNNGSGEISITTSYIGKAKIYYEIIDSKGNKLIKSSLLSSDSTEIFDNLKSFEDYTINIFQKNKGLLLGNDILLKSINRTWYFKRDLIDKVFKIQYIYYYQNKGNNFIEKIERLEKTYVVFTKQISNNVFQGNIYNKNIDKNFWLYKINPVEIEVNSDIIDETMDIYITNEGDGLLFDKKHKNILNDLEDPKAPPIEIYTINLRK